MRRNNFGHGIIDIGPELEINYKSTFVKKDFFVNVFIVHREKVLKKERFSLMYDGDDSDYYDRICRLTKFANQSVREFKLSNKDLIDSLTTVES